MPYKYKVAAWQIMLMHQYQKLQFIEWWLEASSGSESITISMLKWLTLKPKNKQENKQNLFATIYKKKLNKADVCFFSQLPFFRA